MQTHLTDDVQQLVLQAGKHPGIDLRKVAAQLVARQKARHKLPTWYDNAAVVFPPALSVEQASSERTAHYKAGLVSGATLVDLTGGMGVDTWAFAQRIEQVFYVEQNPVLTVLARHNLSALSVENSVVTTQNGLDFIQAFSGQAAWLYLDPARRGFDGRVESGSGRAVQLTDCEPNVVAELPMLLAKTDRILLKASPLIDIDAALRQLHSVDAVYVVAVQGEVKEVLFSIGHALTNPADVQITAVNLKPGLTGKPDDGPDVSFTFRKGDELGADVKLGDPERYLYEPNAAIMKAGAFRLVAARFGLRKLAPNSHLYTSTERVFDFPGRVFAIQQQCKPDRHQLRLGLPGMKANLTVRNFPQSVDALRKKLGLLEGGMTYIIATTLQNGDKKLIVTQKI